MCKTFIDEANVGHIKLYIYVLKGSEKVLFKARKFRFKFFFTYLIMNFH